MTQALVGIATSYASQVAAMRPTFKSHNLQCDTATLLQAGRLLEDRQREGGEHPPSPANYFVQMCQA